MPLAPGTRLDGYELIQILGSGGMGEVWLARDVGLGRKVALKLLPPDFSSDPRRVARFEQEARAASALSHPNICHVYALGQTADGQRYIAMELVEGATLRDRLQQGSRLSLAEALKIASQIAAAVSAAHAAGIVHRDLKPENVIVRADGLVKVLDFGLAKLSQLGDGSTPSDQSTQTVLRTDAGTVVGTVAYMSPEQARGQALDVRTDIWSLGVVLYEAATGHRPFTGAASTDVLAAILEHEPDPLTRFDPRTPPELQRIVTKALRKERSQRYQTMSDLSLDLETLRDELHVKSKSGSGPVSSAGRQPGVWQRRGLWAAVVVASIVGALVIRSAFLGVHQPPAGGSEIVQRKVTRLTFKDGEGFASTFSPDGRMFAFTSDRSGHPGLWIQSVAGGNPIEITKSTAGVGFPTWSPDGDSIAFNRAGEGMLVASSLGGQERRIAPFGDWPRWSPDGTTLLLTTEAFGPKEHLFLAAPDQAPREILSGFLDGGNWHVPMWHPDGRITISGRHRNEGFGIYTISAGDGRFVKSTIPGAILKETRIDPEQVWVWCWGASGNYLYATATADGVMNIWRLRMDAMLRVTAADRLTNGPGSDWAAAISKDGRRVLFSTITGNSRLWSIPLDPQTGKAAGERQPLSEEDGEVNWASLSADGRRVAYFYMPLNSGFRQSELRLLSSPFTGAPERIPADRYIRMASAWSHTGDRLALQAAELSTTGAQTGNALIIRDSAGVEQIVGRCQSSTPDLPCAIAPLAWTPDDSAVLASTRLAGEKTARLTIWSARATTPPVESPRETLTLDAEWNITQASYSPDGRWLAFAYGGEVGDEKGIAVVPASGKVPKSSWIPIGGALQSLGNPRWSSDGRALYFTSRAPTVPFQLWRVGVEPSTGAPVGTPGQIDGVTEILASSYYPTVALGRDRVLVPMNSQHLATWMIDNVDR